VEAIKISGDADLSYIESNWKDNLSLPDNIIDSNLAKMFSRITQIDHEKDIFDSLRVKVAKDSILFQFFIDMKYQI